jgi:hypothetical protein
MTSKQERAIKATRGCDKIWLTCSQADAFFRCILPNIRVSKNGAGSALFTASMLQRVFSTMEEIISLFIC